MDPTIPVVPADLPVAPAIGTMLAERRKVLPVVDGERRLIGIVDRADLLRAVHLLMGGREE
jgi:CBS domain-containing protein